MIFALCTCQVSDNKPDLRRQSICLICYNYLQCVSVLLFLIPANIIIESMQRYSAYKHVSYIKKRTHSKIHHCLFPATEVMKVMTEL